MESTVQLRERLADHLSELRAAVAALFNGVYQGALEFGVEVKQLENSLAASLGCDVTSASNEVDGPEKPIAVASLKTRIPQSSLLQLFFDVRREFFKRNTPDVVGIDADGLWIREEFWIILLDVEDGIGTADALQGKRLDQFFL